MGWAQLGRPIQTPALIITTFASLSYTALVPLKQPLETMTQNSQRYPLAVRLWAAFSSSSQWAFQYWMPMLPLGPVSLALQLRADPSFQYQCHATAQSSESEDGCQAQENVSNSSGNADVQPGLGSSFLADSLTQAWLQENEISQFLPYPGDKIHPILWTKPRITN